MPKETSNGGKVFYSDLFADDIQGGIGGLLAEIGKVKSTLVTMLDEVKAKATEMNSALAGVSSATKADRDATSAYAGEVEKLHGNFEKLLKAVDLVNTQIAGLNKPANKPKTQPVIDLANSYASLDELIRKTGVSLDQLLVSQKQKNIADKNGIIANSSLQGSYNQLYAQYNLIKNVLNAMGTAMRNDTSIGKVWEAQALEIMNAMKEMQEATGKHTLSVGDYGKALNGLQISFMQIAREAPSLGNSVSQFFMAISNNVPIFVESIAQAKKAGLTFTAAIKGMITPFYILQLAIVAVISVLPVLTKNINKKKQAQKEDADAVNEGISAHELYNKALKAQGQEIESSISKLETLYKIATDNTKADKERTRAIEVLREETEGLLDAYDDEAIKAGDAATAIQALTDKLIGQAKVRGALQSIEEYSKKISELELTEKDELYMADQRVDALARLTQMVRNARGALVSAGTGVDISDIIDEETANRFNEIATSLGLMNDNLYSAASSSKKFTKETAKLRKELKSEKATIEAERALLSPATLEEQKQSYMDAIDEIIDNTDWSFLESQKKRERGTREHTTKLKDYYWEWRESIASIISEEVDRELALNDVKYERTIANLKNELAEQKAAGVLSAKQEEYITEIMLNLETERQQKRRDIILKYYEKVKEEINKNYGTQAVEEQVEEADMTISGFYERLLSENARKLIDSRTKLNDALEGGTFREAKAEGQIFKNLTIEKLKLEEELQEKLLKMRLDTGYLTADQYEIELANLRSKLAKDIAGLAKKRRGKFSIWTLLLGDTKEDGKGNVYRELSAESQAFVSSFKEAMSSAFELMDEWMDKRIEMAEIAIEAAEKEVDAARTVYEYEMEARANGYANNVEFARKEYEAKMELERRAVAEKERLQKIQDQIDSAQQFSSLLTATANMWAALTKGNPLGSVLAAAATALMFGSFAAAKIQAAQVTATTKYGEGMSEYLDYGGSHASGHDIDFGADRNGRRRRVERGEMIGVINKRNVDKYGVSTISGIIDSLNKGTFETKYSVVDSVVPEMNADLYHLAFAGMERGMSLDRVESSLQTLVEQGETKVVATPYGRIEYKGNNKRIIRNS